MSLQKSWLDKIRISSLVKAILAMIITSLALSIIESLMRIINIRNLCG